MRRILPSPHGSLACQCICGHCGVWPSMSRTSQPGACRCAPQCPPTYFAEFERFYDTKKTSDARPGALHHVWKTLQPCALPMFGAEADTASYAYMYMWRSAEQVRHLICSSFFSRTGRYQFTSCSGPRWKQPMIGALLLEVEWGHLARLGLPRPVTVSNVRMLARRE